MTRVAVVTAEDPSGSMLMQMTINPDAERLLDTDKRPQENCRTAIPDDRCYKEVQWVLEKGIVEHPRWYPTLTKNSSVEDVQLVLHSKPRLSGVCAKPCLVQRTEGARLPAKMEECRTAVPDDRCYKEVQWVLETGIVEHPRWYPTLTKNSSLEDVQMVLHGKPRLSGVCAKPCPAQKLEGARLPAKMEECRTAVPDDRCYKEVQWVLETGIVEHPRWYPTLTMNSSLEDVQMVLHGKPRLSGVCARPCPAQKLEGARLPAKIEECRTAVPDDRCYKEVQWVLETGIVEHPRWYPTLTKNSSLEDVQMVLHGIKSSVCAKPCPAQESDPLLRTAISGTPLPTFFPSPAPTLAPVPSMAEILARDPPAGYEQKGLNCDCNLVAGVYVYQYYQTREDLDLCADACNDDSDCMAFGFFTNDTVEASWRGNCFLYGTWCPDTDGHAPNNTCPNPITVHAFNVGFNKLPTPPPTPAPTDTYDPCDVSDGSYPSSFYPCSCGSSLCQGNDMCTDTGLPSDAICTVPPLLHVDWPCSSTFSNSWYFYHVGTTSSGAPVYSNQQDPTLEDVGVMYLYWDRDCSGNPNRTEHFFPIWILDTASPNLTADLNLDGIPGCGGLGKIFDYDMYGPPLYNWTWEVGCDGAVINGTVVITLASSVPTPGPTMMPGMPCPCDPCGYLPWTDLDGDGCVTLEEITIKPGEITPDNYGAYDADSDGCISQEECLVQPRDLQTTFTFPIPNPGECDYGFFLLPGTSVCQQCDGGFTRRRRSDACTQCPPGRIDPGDFDDCLAGVWITKTAEVGDDKVYVNRDKLESGVLLTITDGITMATRNPDYYERAIVTGKVGFLSGQRLAHDASQKTEKSFNGSTLTANISAGVVGVNQVVPLGHYENLGIGDSLLIEGGGNTEIIMVKNLTVAGIVLLDPTEHAYPAGSSVTLNDEMYLELDHPLNNPFYKWDPITPACNNVNGNAIEDKDNYPCGCGREICQTYYKCWETCVTGTSTGTRTSVNGSSGEMISQGDTGCCVDPDYPPNPTPIPTVSAKGDPHLVNLQGEHFDINHGGEFTLLRIPQATSEPAEMQLRASIGPEYGKPCTTYITEVEFTGTWLDNKSVQVRCYQRSHLKNGTDKFLSVRVLQNKEDQVPWVNITEAEDGDKVLNSNEARLEVTLSKQVWFSKKSSAKAKASSPTVAGQFTLSLRNKRNEASAKIIVRQDIPVQEHLNVAVRRLSALGRVDVGGLLGFDAHSDSLEEVTQECQRHRDGMDGKKGPKHDKASWKTRWQKIKTGHSHQNVPGGAMDDNEASAALIGNRRASSQNIRVDEETGEADRNLVCACENTEADEQTGESIEQDLMGVVVDYRTALMAEASWD